MNLEREVARLRRAQEKAVMPLIGPLLDAFEGLSFDARSNEELSELFACIEKIQDAMESEDAP